MRRGEIVAKRYRIESAAAEGGMGTVYRGVDLKTHLSVAVKVLRPAGNDDVERFVREAALLATVEHARIVKYIDHGETSHGMHFLVMEWVEGRTLADLLASEGVNIPEAVCAALSVAEGLEVLHATGIIHRDIKPRNLMVTDPSFASVKILDLGVARSEEQASLTRTGYMVGSAGYLAPEHARGVKDLDGRSDLFSLGCVLYECLSGDAPFAGTGMLSVRTKLLVWDPPPLQTLNPDVSSELERLVSGLLQKDPERRPRSATVVVERLRALTERDGMRRKRNERRFATTEATRTVARPSTLKSGPTEPIFMLFIGGQEADQLTEDSVETRDRLAAIPGASRFDFIGDGWFVITLTGNGPLPDAAASAAQSALTLRKSFLEEPMILIGEESDLALGFDAMIERGVALSAVESRYALFPELSAHPGSGAVRLDEKVVTALNGRFALKRSQSGVYLVAPDSTAEVGV